MNKGPERNNKYEHAFSETYNKVANILVVKYVEI